MKRFLRHIVVYPYLLAAVPLLHLYVTNIRLVEFSTMLAYLLSIWAGVLIVHLAAIKFAKTSAGILTSIIVMTLLYYGVFYNALDTLGKFGTTFQQHIYLLPVWLIALTAIAVWVIVKRIDSKQVNNYLTFLSITLMVVILFPVLARLNFRVDTSPLASAKEENPISSALTPTQGRPLDVQTELETQPDVYYIILDGYAGADILSTYYDFDNKDFLNALSARGFYVSSRSSSNYVQTNLSLTSSLNIDYLDALMPDISSQPLKALYPFFKNNRVTQIFNDLGYTTIHFASGYGPTNENALADMTLSFSKVEQFNGLLLKTTILTPIAGKLVKNQKRVITMSAFKELEKIPEMSSSTFTFAHLLVPHFPYVFDREGNMTNYSETEQGWPQQPYTDQVVFVNQKMLEVIDAILAKSTTPPIIVIQGDHGPGSRGMQPHERMSILNAYYLPKTEAQYLYPTISPVNTFRLIFDLYFDKNFGLLDDKKYFSPYEDNFNFCTVSDISPSDTDKQIWSSYALGLLKENSRIEVNQDCKLEQFLLFRHGFEGWEKNENDYIRWGGSTLRLQFPVEARQPYIFLAKVKHILPTDAVEVELFVDNEFIEKKSVSRGESIVQFFIPAQYISSPVVNITIKQNLSQPVEINDKREDLRLAYYWIEWTSDLTKFLENIPRQAGPEDYPLITLDTALEDVTGIDPLLQTPEAWGIENYDGGSLLWLGHGEAEGLRGTLWSTEARSAYAIFEVEPGPARTDQMRTVELSLTNAAGTQTARQQFDRPTKLIFPLELQMGENKFTFAVLDDVTDSHPGGDSRPLLALLRHIFVTSSTRDFTESQAGPSDHPLIVISPTLADQVGIDPLLQTSEAWGIENYDGGSLLWLGYGETQGLRGTLWAATTRKIQISLQVEPGPARSDRQRTVELMLANAAGAQATRQQFDQATNLTFTVELQPGANEFGLTVLEKPTILVQPDSETRPLLVLLHHVTIEPE